MDGALGNPGLLGDGAYDPVCCGLWFTSECLGDQLGYRLILHRAGSAATHLVVEPFDPIGDLRHLPIVWGPTPKPRRHDGIAALLGSRSHASMIFARNVSAAGNERDRVMAKRSARSSLDIVRVVLGGRFASGSSFDQDTRNQ
jgi:hypothetical protein